MKSFRYTRINEKWKWNFKRTTNERTVIYFWIYLFCDSSIRMISHTRKKKKKFILTERSENCCFFFFQIWIIRYDDDLEKKRSSSMLFGFTMLLLVILSCKLHTHMSLINQGLFFFYNFGNLRWIKIIVVDGWMRMIHS